MVIARIRVGCIVWGVLMALLTVALVIASSQWNLVVATILVYLVGVAAGVFTTVALTNHWLIEALNVKGGPADDRHNHD